MQVSKAHSRTVYALPRTRKKLSTRDCCKSKDSPARSTTRSPFTEIIENLQDELERKAGEARALRKRIREMELREVELSEQLDGFRRRAFGQGQGQGQGQATKRTKSCCRQAQVEIEGKLEKEVQRLEHKLAEQAR
jgi:hypothetical protein